MHGSVLTFTFLEASWSAEFSSALFLFGAIEMERYGWRSAWISFRVEPEWLQDMLIMLIVMVIAIMMAVDEDVKMMRGMALMVLGLWLGCENDGLWR